MCNVGVILGSNVCGCSRLMSGSLCFLPLMILALQEATYNH